MAKDDEMTFNGFPATLDWVEDPDEGMEAAKKAKEAAEGNNGPDAGALEAQLAALQGQIANLTQANRALMTQAPQFQPQFQTDVNMQGLPDSLVDPEGYQRELNQRISFALDQRRQAENYQAQQANQQNQKLADLWDEFQENYPAYAGKFVGIEAVATKVAERAARRGVDVNRYMFANSEQFMSDVVKAYDKEFGTPVVEGADEETEETKETNRATGVFGGAVSGGKPSGDDDVEPADMFADLKQFQLKHGLYR